MTKEELILKGKHKVRGSSDLMSIYIDLFQKQHGYRPNCAGCTFDTDWQKFTANRSDSKPLKTNKMTAEEKTTFVLRSPSPQLIAYKKDKRTYRAYSNKAPESFMIEYLTLGTDEEITERKKLFKTLPKSLREEKPKAEVVKKKKATK